MQRRKILVVDDYPGARYCRSRVLSSAGFEVVEAATGERALVLADYHVPDLILLDVHLPDMSGFDVCEQLRKSARTAAIPVVHISSVWSSEPYRERGRASGGDAFLSEPVEGPTLVSSLTSLIDARR